MLFHVILIVYIFMPYYYDVCMDSTQWVQIYNNTGELASPAQIKLQFQLF